jgi:2-polyprenyl-3-methyl-5-hydroxy-6-metoxy-1,4-benzoquinol methylase
MQKRDFDKDRSANNCFLCKKEGHILYKNMDDKIFHVPGIWDFYKCKNCGLVWVHPFPSLEDIRKFHTEYEQINSKISYNTESSLRNKIKMSLIAANFSYREKLKIKYSKILRLFFKVFFNCKTIGGRLIMYLQGANGNRLLDIGCGEGDFLTIIHDLGWQVVGVEQDSRAIKIAREKFGVNIINKDFYETELSKNNFDAVTADNVIEHVKDPIDFLKRAGELVKSGGKLIVATPNINSLGHLFFKKRWRHLFPPRHLFLFSADTLSRCFQEAGFTKIKIRFSSISAFMMFQNSLDTCIKGKSKGGLYFSFFGFIPSLIFQILESFLCVFKPSLGEEIILEAEKNK